MKPAIAMMVLVAVPLMASGCLVDPNVEPSIEAVAEIRFHIGRFSDSYTGAQAQNISRPLIEDILAAQQQNRGSEREAMLAVQAPEGDHAMLTTAHDKWIDVEAFPGRIDQDWERYYFWFNATYFDGYHNPYLWACNTHTYCTQLQTDANRARTHAELIEVLSG